MPHPAYFSLHKLIIFQRRSNLDKREKDMKAAIEILNALTDKGEQDIVKQAFNSLHKKWQNKILKNLRLVGEESVANDLSKT